MSISNQTAVVTGGAGFLGSHTVERLLAEGCAVRVLDLPAANYQANLGPVLDDPNLTIHEKNLLDVNVDDPVFSDVQYVFHCSAIGEHVASHDAPEALIQANVVATVRILEASRQNGVRKVVYPSSAAVYGIAECPTREDHPANPGNAYGITKELAEVVFQRWAGIYGVASAVFRIFNGYGPRAARSGVVGAFINRRMNGDPIVILGDGTAERDFVYVSDIVDAFLLGATTEATGIYNLGSGVTRTVKELATLIGGAIEYGPAREGEPPIIFADIQRARDELGWQPVVTLEQGIADVLASLGLEH